MKKKTGKTKVLLGMVCTLNLFMAGCGTTHEYTDTAQNAAALAEALSDTPSEDTDAEAEKIQESGTGRWQVLEPEVAAA